MDSFEETYDEPISYISTETQNNDESQEPAYNSLFLGCPKATKLSLLLVLSIIVGVYFVTTFYILNILLIPMNVQGGSMYPTLNYEYETTNNTYAQDVVYLWETQNVEYGDVVVFNAINYDQSHADKYDQIYYIKRVIAVEGDTLQFKRVGDIESGYLAKYVLYKNGELLEEPYIADDMFYNVLAEAYPHIINEEIIIVPEGYVYLMGDNRNNSKDSRELGLIKTSDIVGKVSIHIPYGTNLLYGIFVSIKNGYLF